MTLRKKIAMLIAEFLGTTILALVIMTVANSDIGSITLFTALAAGLTLAGLVLALGAVSGGHFNPAVTFGLWTTRKVPTLQALAYIAVQMLGGLVAWKLFNYLNVNIMTRFGGVIQLHAADQQTVEFVWKTFWAEVIGAFVFMFGIASAVFQKQKAGRAASVIGISLTLGVLVATLNSKGLLNPAIALTSDNFNWTYTLAPLLGGLVAFNLYYFLLSEEPLLVSFKMKEKSAVYMAEPVKATVVKAKSTTKKPAKKTTAKNKKK